MIKTKKRLFGGIALITGLLIVAGFALELGGIIPLWGYEVLLVALFPIFVICLGLWWMAKEHEPDIPFLGY
jgi:hypothetical protein